MYEQKCTVFNSNTKMAVEADILDFRRKKSLSVSIMKSIKLKLNWNDKSKKYEGSYSSMEFETEGPKELMI